MAYYADAFENDVRPLLGRWRNDRGLEADPVQAFRDGDYAEQRARDRGTASMESAYEQL